MDRWRLNPKVIVSGSLLLLLIVAMACGADATPTPVVIEKEVVKEVVKEVEVIKEVPVEKEVIKEVEVVKEVLVEKEVVKEVEVIKEVPVEKEVIKEVEVVKEVEVIVVATPTPTPPPIGPVEPKVDMLKVMTAPIRFEHSLPWQGSGSEMNQNVRHFMETLVFMEPFTGRHVPGLATEWEMAPGAMQWTFKLREDIPFHFGWGEFTAQDVVHTFTQMVREDAISSDAKRWRNLLGDTPESVRERIKVVDPHTVLFDLKVPELDFEIEHTGRIGVPFILSKAQWDAEGEEAVARKAAGTNTYQFVKRELGRFMELERVDDHWRTTPDFKRLQILYAAEAATRLAALLAKEVHMAVIPRPLYGQARERGMEILRSTIPANAITIGLGGLYHPDSPYYDPDVPFLNKKVREAINRALNRDEINQEIFGGAGDPVYVQGFHQSSAGWNPDWATNFERDYGYDPERARELLKEAGYPDGFKVFPVLTQLAQLPEMLDVGQATAIYMEDIGLDVEILEIEFGVFRAMFREGRLHNSLSNLPRSITPPDGAIRTFNLSLGAGGPVAYSETEFIEVNYPKYKLSVDPEERETLLRAMGDHKYEEYVEVPLFWLFGEIASNPDIVADYRFSGGIAGTYTHWEYVRAVPK